MNIDSDPIALIDFIASGNEFVDNFARSVRNIGFSVGSIDWETLGHKPVDLLIFHWPNEFFGHRSKRRVLRLIGRIYLAKIRFRTRVVWVVHNVKPHENPTAVYGFAERLFFACLNGVIYLSRASASLVEQAYPRLRRIKSLTTVHGIYECRQPARPRKESAVVRLLFFGRLRRYKNIELLMAAVAATAPSDISLDILGFPDDQAYGAELNEASGSDPRIRVRASNALIDNETLDGAIDAADGIVLPYKEVLNSGAALHALSRSRAVLVPAIGSLPELAEEIGTQWVQLYKGDIDKNAITDFIDLLREKRSFGPDLSGYSWDRVTRDLAQFFNTLGLGRHLVTYHEP